MMLFDAAIIAISKLTVATDIVISRATTIIADISICKCREDKEH
jgi:hypothetical protein